MAYEGIVLELVDSIGASLDSSQVMKLAATFFVQKLRLSNCSIIANGKKASYFADKKYDALDEAVAKQIAETRAPILVSGLKDDFMFGKFAGELSGCFAAFPINMNGSTGAVILYSEQRLEPQAEVATALVARLSKALSASHLFTQAQQCAVSDLLTGLYNKAYFTEALKNEIAQAARFRRPTSLIMFDFDNFKQFNDTKGHPAGDKLLKDTGAIVRENTRPSDICCRYGGEEFTIILPETMPEQAKEVADRLRKVVEDRFNLDTTISLGICGCINSSVNHERMVSEADKALYRAKQVGKNTVMMRIIVDKNLGVVET
jgi:diguanylate cyclase (GGDEF)-like protein